MEISKPVVTITKDQKAKAIGKSGIDIRLASMFNKVSNWVARGWRCLNCSNNFWK